MYFETLLSLSASFCEHLSAKLFSVHIVGAIVIQKNVFFLHFKALSWISTKSESLLLCTYSSGIAATISYSIYNPSFIISTPYFSTFFSNNTFIYLYFIKWILFLMSTFLSRNFIAATTHKKNICVTSWLDHTNV